MSMTTNSGIPSDKQNGTCLLGRKTIYKRRIAHAHCYNGYDYDRPIMQHNCPCDREDFECDMGYRDTDYNECAFDTSSGLTPTSVPSFCPVGSTYRRTKGYRKVAGDTCQGGMKDQFCCRNSFLSDTLITLGDHIETTIPLGSGLQNAIALDYDYKQNCIYWADITLDTIKRTFLNGSEIETLHGGIQQVEGLALDWLGDNIYWVDAAAKKIEVSRADGRFRKTLFTNLDRPRAIVLDPKRGYMYWTDWDTNARIERSYMSGTGRAVIISTNLRWPNGIAIDFPAQKLYWTDAGLDKIERSNLDGSYRQTISSTGLPHPYSISVYKDSIYWGDWTTQSIQKANKRDAGARQTIRSHVRGLMDLKVFHQDAQTGDNSCSRLKQCTHICLAVPNSYTCACPDNMRTVTTASGIVSCECQPGEYMDPNGECKTRSEYLTVIATAPITPAAQHSSDVTMVAVYLHHGSVDHDDDCHDMSDERNCTFPTCQLGQFTCANSRCIPQRWVCDFDNDCRDGSDEQGCTPAPTISPPPADCSSTQFACHNDHCIPSSWYCDGDQDCGDGSDEPSNNYCISTRKCSPSQFTCQNRRCIPSSWHCDGDNDCLDNSDEQHCTYTTPITASTATPWTRPTSCKAYEYRCHNGFCIYQWDVCDGVDDCGDNSDEWYCATTPTPAHNATTPFTRPCHYWEFTCPNGWCINSGYRCNGRDDCGDGSDESGCSYLTATARLTTTSNPLCPAGWLHCGDTSYVICIRTEWLCDGVDNCPGGWDERPQNCPKSTRRPITCSSSEYQCTDGTCVPLRYQCDGIRQCIDGSDEVGCGGGTPSTCPDFLCDSKTVCLPLARRCDHMPDCKDGTDEKNCRLLVCTLLSVSDNWHQEDTQHNNFYIVSYLQPCSKYEFGVQVLLSGSAPGPLSTTIKTTTLTAKTSAPRNVLHVLKGDGSLQITWDVPLTTCHVVTNYKIFYKQITRIGFQIIETGNVQVYRITGLAGGVTYEIKLQAFSVDGGGDLSNVQYVRIPIIPTHPTAPVPNPHYTSVNATTVVLAWGTPTQTGVMVPVLGYKVYETMSGGLVLLIITDKHNYTVYSLLPRTSYSFTVKPYNQIGDGPPAFIAVTTTGGSAPQSVIATPLNSTAITLTWSPPKHGQSGEPMYYIYYGTLTSGVSTRPVGHTAATTFVVGHLQQDFVYVFEVSLGLTGQHSDPVNSKPKSDADYQPVHSLKAVVVNSSSIVLTWQKPIDVTLNDIKNYQIKMSLMDQTFTKTTKGKETTYTFRYLHFNASYTFEVRTIFVKRDLGKDVSIVKTTGPFSASVGPLRKTIEDNTVVLSWSAPRTISSTDLKHYKVFSTCPGCYNKLTPQLTDKTTIKFPNLQRGQTYTFSVQAGTAYGAAQNSTTSATINLFFGQVGNLRQSILNKTVTLQWDAPTDVDAKHIKVPSVVPKGKQANIKVTVPPLDLKVRYAGGSPGGKYGLTVNLYWARIYDRNVQYEVRWHCIRGHGYCYWYDGYPWSMTTVNTTSVALNMTHYGVAYLYEVRVVTSQGRGEPYQVYVYVPQFNGMPKRFTCTAASSHSLVCHWLPPTDFNPSGFYHYSLKYKCDDCLVSSMRYKSVYGFNQTSVNISVNSGARFTVWIQVHTRYGFGKWVQTTATTQSSLGAVRALAAILDDKDHTLVHLSWLPPSYSSGVLVSNFVL
ncbi:Sortilin- receptor [Desmophyllum pertusum]|uniref:Sortilin-related receptor n=1 Tax=Desmophyllum pertusum TaxID=174260 RepID=A0A9X0D289_9CNID|nr:Sortilin- receptor [Desmophyllum pertusum]